MEDKMRDPAIYQIVQSPSNTRAERMDVEEGCAAHDYTSAAPTQERRMNRHSVSSPLMGASLFKIRFTSSRSPSSKR